MVTVAQYFQQEGLPLWWNFITQRFNPPNEYGTDFGCGGFGGSVGAVASGKVIYVGDPYANDPNHSSLNYVVQIVDPSSLELWHYQHLWGPAVAVGDTVLQGQVVGVQGGCPLPGDGWPCGNNGCPDNTCDDWTTGSHIEVRYAPVWSSSGGVWSQNWIDPLSAIDAAAQAQMGSAPPPPGGHLPGGGGIGNPGGPPLPVFPLAPNAAVHDLLIELDVQCMMINPFYVQNVTQDNIGIGPVGVSITDPISWLTGFGLNIVEDTQAWIIRAVMLWLGIFIVYKVINNFIDFGAIADTVENAAQTLGKIALVAAG